MRDKRGKLLRGPEAWEAAQRAMAAKNDRARRDTVAQHATHDQRVSECRQAAEDRQAQRGPT